jgi:hypothetical protein
MRRPNGSELPPDRHTAKEMAVKKVPTSGSTSALALPTAVFDLRRTGQRTGPPKGKPRRKSPILV